MVSDSSMDARIRADSSCGHIVALLRCRPLKQLSKTQLRDYVIPGVFDLDDEELDDCYQALQSIFDSFEAFSQRPAPPPANIPAVREAGARPTGDQDPFNAIVRWCTVHAESGGLLSGKRIGLKDNIAIAGIPLTNGSQILQGYVPQVDAVIVDRLLREGAEIVAVTNMDNFAWYGATSHYGPILNPVDPARKPGGSSGGSAAALYYDSVDITFGTDQGGSIRYPAAFCGVLGLKPTLGLVPYTGIIGMDRTYDHVGPMARRVEDLALAMQAVARPEDPDARHAGASDQFVDVVAGAADDLSGLTLGVLSEGFDGAEALVAEATREAVTRMRDLGATVTTISVPEHRDALDLATVCWIEGMTASFLGFGNGYHSNGRYAEDLALALGTGLRAFGNELPPQLKAGLLAGTYFRERRFSTLYAKAQNLRPVMRAAYDAALSEVDFLVTPTAPDLPQEHQVDGTSSESATGEETASSFEHRVDNLSAFNMTGHPALSIPASHAGGLPVGVQIVGPRFSDARMLALARTYEKSHPWFPAPDERDQE
jgi:amidase